MDMTMGRLEAAIRRWHNEYTAKIRGIVNDPVKQPYYFYEMWKIVRYYLSEDKNKQKEEDELGPVMDSLSQLGYSFGGAYELALELIGKISIMQEDCLHSGYEGNDVEFIQRYADACGLVGCVCSHFKCFYDSHDKDRILEVKQNSEFLLHQQEENRRRVRKYLNKQSLLFGLMMFGSAWLLMVERHVGRCVAVLAALFLSILGAEIIGYGIRYSEKFEKVEKSIENFWCGAVSVLILLFVSYFIPILLM